MILNIETATTNCSVSIAQEGLVVFFKEYANVNYSHAEQLHLFIQEVLNQASFSFSALTAIAVSKGPGSYTGLRIGVSAAKGLCYALGIPLISVPTLKSLASSYTCGPQEVLVPMLDARRMEVYMSVFNHKQQEVIPTCAKVLVVNGLDRVLENFLKVYFIGSGAQKAMDLYPHLNAVGFPNALPSAKDMAPFSYASFTAQDFESVAYFEPYYLKDFMGPIPKKKA